MINQNMLYGVHIGEHGFTESTVIDEIEERVMKPGYNFVTKIVYRGTERAVSVDPLEMKTLQI